MLTYILYLHTGSMVQSQYYGTFFPLETCTCRALPFTFLHLIQTFYQFEFESEEKNTKPCIWNASRLGFDRPRPWCSQMLCYAVGWPVRHSLMSAYFIGTDTCILRDRNFSSVKNTSFCLSANAVGNLTKLLNTTVDPNQTFVSPSEEYFKWVGHSRYSTPGSLYAYCIVGKKRIGVNVEAPRTILNFLSVRVQQWLLGLWEKRILENESVSRNSNMFSVSEGIYCIGIHFFMHWPSWRCASFMWRN